MISAHESNESATPPEPLSVLGVPIVPFVSYAHAVRCIEQAVSAGRKSFWVAINPQKIHRAGREPRLREVLNRADVGVCDGIGVSIAVRLLYGRVVKRCTGCDLFFTLLATAAKRGWGVFLLGATPASNAEACRRLRQRYPGLRIVGGQHGYFEDSAAAVERINASGAVLLFVGMGSPKQEYWIFEHRRALRAAFCMGVGGSFNVASGDAKRAPKLFRRTGTEFLFQLMTEPWRWKRQMAYVPYLWSVVRESLFGRHRGPKASGQGAIRAPGDIRSDE